MLEALSTAWELPGLWFLALGALAAGLVRGFSGFGTAMVYLPVAAQVLGPFEALTTLMVKDLVAPLIHVPRALRDGHPGDVLRLAAGAVIAVPVGVWVLTLVAPEVFRWGVSVVALFMVVALISGLRYRGTLTKPMIFGTGAAGGFLAGSVGLPGPPVILLYMASSLPPAAIRANNMLYLILADIILLTVLWIKSLLVLSAVAIGVLMIVPYLAGNWIGGRIFRPEAEALYRRIAYVMIAISAVMGLPIWG